MTRSPTPRRGNTVIYYAASRAEMDVLSHVALVTGVHPDSVDLLVMPAGEMPRPKLRVPHLPDVRGARDPAGWRWT